MAKDYARQSHTKHHARSSKRRGTKAPLVLWVVTFLAVGVFILGLLYLKHYRSTLHKLKGAPNKTMVIAAKLNLKSKYSLKQDNNADEKKDPNKDLQFDFYTILPKLKVKPDVISASLSEQFILRVEKVNTASAANELKAKLSTMGFGVLIGKTSLSGGRFFYKVATGPYATREAAGLDRKRLHENGFTGELEQISFATKD